MTRAIIIENELAASNLLTKIVTSYCPDVELVGTAATIIDGLKLIHKADPELVFLDIELDDGQSFDILEMLKERPFKVIFTTAYDEYALKAFKYDAVDYILKPYTPKTVGSAVNRVSKRFEEGKALTKLNKFLDKSNTKQRLTLHTSTGIRICSPDEILRLEADSSYCTVYVITGEKVLVSKPLGDIESQLPADQFFRVHASHTVNINHVNRILNQDGGSVVLNNGTHIPLARRRKQEFLNILK